MAPAPCSLHRDKFRSNDSTIEYTRALSAALIFSFWFIVSCISFSDSTDQMHIDLLTFSFSIPGVLCMFLERATFSLCSERGNCQLISTLNRAPCTNRSQLVWTFVVWLAHAPSVGLMFDSELVWFLEWRQNSSNRCDLSQFNAWWMTPSRLCFQ